MKTYSKSKLAACTTDHEKMELCAIRVRSASNALLDNAREVMKLQAAVDQFFVYYDRVHNAVG
jgi:hypothetical protein